MQIDLAHRSTSSWLDAADLAREVYAQAYGADVAPRPDSFIVARPACGAAEEPCAPLACAGLTFGRDQELFSERYLETGVEDAALARLGASVDRRRVVEVGALATRRASVGRELIRATPIIAWCLGMEYILCTATRSLITTLERTGISFVPFGPADPRRLTPDEAARWGTYYDQEPQVGVIPLNALDRLFSDATGRYSVTDLQLSISAMEVAGHAGH
ncbi:thermostable hemolysin [Streptomyces tubercidicus]|uniref:Thermostable hemolysin n=1 Tax=Streptomyces tubercidicus TaxID=47759 RepID=A0A640V153_9ACTN|nr:thermostable hemolysin [Streptomyces tubercidicus]WAU16172.1 thermostable hemolysin [Streptomyces tubercidicus]WSK39264.1 thermostable hemolysin [Streptomyces tubercidicus]WSX18479.1 thermostable hemolysin [Streptomyces tubercidicus]GFE42113.1 thermostable hemolysin [Streptomyces tubercidicus]